MTCSSLTDGKTVCPTPGREQRGNHVRINPGEYSVYHFFAKSLVRCTPDGEMLNRSNELGYVFGDLADAQRYCLWKVNENPKLACTIYDNDRKIADQIFNPKQLERVSRANAPKRQLFTGVLLLGAGSGLVWIDAKHDWMLIVGFLIGARLAVGGVVKIVLGLGEWKARRSA